MKIGAFAITFLTLVFQTNCSRFFWKRSPSQLGGGDELSKMFGKPSTSDPASGYYANVESSHTSEPTGGDDKWNILSHGVYLPIKTTRRDFSVSVKSIAGETAGMTALIFKNGSYSQRAKVNIRYYHGNGFQYKSADLGGYETVKFEIPISAHSIGGYAEAA